jgi:hypothetical protein
MQVVSVECYVIHMASYTLSSCRSTKAVGAANQGSERSSCVLGVVRAAR